MGGGRFISRLIIRGGRVAASLGGPQLGSVAQWLMRDAEDVLQDAMLRALTYFPSFKGVNSRGWLLQIVRNTAYASMSLNRGVDLVPLTNTRDEPADIVAQLPSGDHDPETSLIKSQERER